MNRNFLTAFCIVALVGLSCPIVAKMACPVDEYFNQELELITSPTLPYQLFIVSQPLSISTSVSGQFRFSCAVSYSGNVEDLTFTWFRISPTNLLITDSTETGVYMSYSRYYYSTNFANYKFYCSISDGVTTIDSDIVTLTYTGNSKFQKSEEEVFYDFQIGGENDEKSEIIDEPIKKEEDIEESETELSEDTEIIE